MRSDRGMNFIQNFIFENTTEELKRRICTVAKNEKNSLPSFHVRSNSDSIRSFRKAGAPLRWKNNPRLVFARPASYRRDKRMERVYVGTGLPPVVCYEGEISLLSILSYLYDCEHRKCTWTSSRTRTHVCLCNICR